jgi:hypothetical protein
VSISRQTGEWLFGIFGLIVAILCAGNVIADSMTSITGHAAQGSNDYVTWSQLGPDATTLEASENLQSAGNIGVELGLGGSGSIISAVCPSAEACSWTGSGFASGDSLLWTSDRGNGGTGPATLTFNKPVAGAGALIQADGPAQFTAQIQVFNGTTSLGSFPITSDINGDAAYIGVKDQTGADITSAIFSLTSCEGNCADFAIDTVYLNTAAGPPTPTPTPIATPTPVAASLTASTRRLELKNKPKTVALRNRRTPKRNQTIIVTSISSSSTEFAPSGECVAALAPRGRCEFSVSFTPSPAGTHRGMLTITSNATDPVIVIELVGKITPHR